MSFFKKLNKLITRVENKGFEAANVAHKWTINCILLFIVYNFTSTIVGYNQSFKEARVGFAFF